jgi:hypothetical protein
MMIRAFMLSLAALLGCSRDSATSGLKDPAAMKSALLQLVPPGTSLPKAREAMEHEGFTVTEKHDASFAEQGKVHNDIDYLYCDRTESARFPVERRWQVALVSDGTKVTNILVSVGLTGP